MRTVEWCETCDTYHPAGEHVGTETAREERPGCGHVRTPAEEQELAEAAARILPAPVPSPGAPCPHGDPSCPCPDGDMCHYDGPDAWPSPGAPDEVEALAQALYAKDKFPGSDGWLLWEEHSEKVHDIWRGYAVRLLASDWLRQHDAEAQAQALREAKDDIGARLATFRDLNADDQYLNALKDAWGLVANRERAAERARADRLTREEGA